MQKPLPGLAITDESDAELMAAVIATLLGGKRKKIARRVAKMRARLEARATPTGVVLLRGDANRKWQRARATEALERIDRVAHILSVPRLVI